MADENYSEEQPPVVHEFVPPKGKPAALDAFWIQCCRKHNYSEEQPPVVHEFVPPKGKLLSSMLWFQCCRKHNYDEN